MAAAHAADAASCDQYSDLVGKWLCVLLDVADWLTDSSREARDLLQDSLVAGYHALPASRQDTDIREWLLKQMCALHHTCSSESTPATRRPAVAAGQSDGEVGHRLDRAMRSLPSWLRTPLVLCDVAGLPYEQIARVLGLPVGAVRSRVFRAREALTRSLQSSGGKAGAWRRGDVELAPTASVA